MMPWERKKATARRELSPHLEPKASPGRLPAAILYRAEDWFQRFEAGELDKRSALALLHWLQTDPRHVEAFKATAKGEPARGVDQMITHIEQANLAPIETRSRGPRRWPRVLLLAILLIVVGAFALVIAKDPTLRNLPQRLGASYAAPSGESRQVTLPDGSEVLLDSETAINTKFQSSQRFVEFLGGEALIEVSERDSRPFLLRSAKVTVEAIGTRFAIRDDGRSALVTVYKGAVRIEPADHPDHATVIPANAAVRVEETTGPLLPAAQGNPDAWRRGLLPDQDLTLEELVHALQRYTPGTILLLRGNAGNRPVSGPFSTDDVAGTLRGAIEGQNLKVLSFFSDSVLVLY